MSQRSSTALVSEVASEQSGLITAAQARRLRVTNSQMARLAATGVLERVRHGVYVVRGAPHDDLRDLRAAWLSLDPSRTAAERLEGDEAPAVVSHWAATHVHELGVQQGTLVFTLPGRKQSRDADLRLHRGRIDPGDWEVLRGLPVTTVARTVADLAGKIVDGGHLAEVVRDAVVQGKAQIVEVSDALSPHAHRYGAPTGDGRELVRRLLGEAGVPLHIGEIARLSKARAAPAASSGEVDGRRSHE